MSQRDNYVGRVNDISIGDVVILKSGGPQMTIDNMWRDAVGGVTALCKWFEGSNLLTGTFNVSMLVKPPSR
jgi:uncharacterized protein YodC (DUF2158 family)